MAAVEPDGDAVMADAGEATVAPSSAAAEDNSTSAQADAPAELAADTGPPPADRVAQAEAAKEAGNTLLKMGDPASAVGKYKEGIELTEALLEKSVEELGCIELQQRATSVYTALRLNSAQACLKLCDWKTTAEHAEKVLLVDKDNCKALYRRGVALLNFEGRLEDARADLARVAQLEPTNREFREKLQEAKERIRELRQREKERYAGALTGGLYKEQHAKLARQEERYQQEVKRRAEAGEAEISFDDFQKKEKEKEDEAKKKEKEERERRLKEEAEAAEIGQWEEANALRRSRGEEELTLEVWRAQKDSQPKKSEVVRTDDLELDEEEKAMLKEQKDKGYYHGRLGTVLSMNAPTPQQVREAAAAEEAAAGVGHSAWNLAGTWEDRSMTSWAKASLTKWLTNASVTTSWPGVGDLTLLTAKVTKVKSVTGEAQMVMVRGRKKCGYDFTAELSFRMLVSNPSSAAGEDASQEKEKFDGYFKLPDLSDTVQLDDLQIIATWKGAAPPDRLQAAADKCVAQLRQNLREQVAAFLAEYREQ